MESNLLDSAGPQALAEALQLRPVLQLSFYDFGVILRRPLEDGSVTEYPVDPGQIAEMLAAKTELSTGLLLPDTLYVWTSGQKRLTVGYRPAQRTALYLEGADTPLRVPLPGLVMLRLTMAGQSPRYGVFAMKRRPMTLEAPLFHAPLPNVYGMGGVCWGSVRHASENLLSSTDLSEEWTLLLGSLFTPHSIGGKSKQERDDIRKQLIHLEARGARVYPTRDLVLATEVKTLRVAIEKSIGEKLQ